MCPHIWSGYICTWFCNLVALIDWIRQSSGAASPKHLKQSRMKTIKLVPGKYNREEIIVITFKADKTIEKHLIGLQGLQRNHSDGTLYLKNSSKNLNLVFNHMRKIKCYVDYSELKQKRIDIPKKGEKLCLPPIDSLNKQDLERFRRWLKEKRLSPNTVDTYVEVTSFFLRYAKSF